MRGKHSEPPWRQLRHRWRSWRWTRRFKSKRVEALWALPADGTRIVGLHFSDGTCLIIAHTLRGPSYRLRKQKAPVGLDAPAGGRVRWARSGKDELTVAMDGEFLFVDWRPDELEISMG